MTQSAVTYAFILSFLAGTATLIGGAAAFMVKRHDMKIFSIGMGFSAGVMIFVSFMELLPQAQKGFIAVYGDKTASWITIAAFFGGIILAGIIDQLIPEHHLENEEIPAGANAKVNNAKLNKLGVFTALAIAIHNFPEGLATFMSALSNTALGVSIAVAVAIHNIPEGMAVALPTYNATGSRKKALIYAGLSGMAEPLGAILGYLIFRNIFNQLTFSVLFAVVAGIMIYISFDELLPTANEYGDGHKEILGVLVGMFVMAVSIAMLH